MSILIVLDFELDSSAKAIGKRTVNTAYYRDSQQRLHFLRCNLLSMSAILMFRDELIAQNDPHIFDESVIFVIFFL